LEQAKERAGLRERLGVRFPDLFDLTPVRHDERWQVRLIIPTEWDDSRSIRATARFLARLVHTQARISRRVRRSARL
jgi:hypothetical protein